MTMRWTMRCHACNTLIEKADPTIDWKCSWCGWMMKGYESEPEIREPDREKDSLARKGKNVYKK